MEWCEYLSRSFFGILYLYLWYNHTISVSNGCVEGISPCDLFKDCLYYFQSHLSLHIGMVIRYFLVSSYMCATSFSVCMVFVSTFISLSGLHSLVEICASWIINCKGMYQVSLFCTSEKIVFIMFV